MNQIDQTTEKLMKQPEYGGLIRQIYENFQFNSIKHTVNVMDLFHSLHQFN